MMGHKFKVVKKKLPRYLVGNGLQNVIFPCIDHPGDQACLPQYQAVDLAQGLGFDARYRS